MDLRPVEVMIEPELLDTTNTVRVEARYSGGYFHCWEQYVDPESFARVYGLVELDGGQMRRFEVDEIRFLDKPKQD